MDAKNYNSRILWKIRFSALFLGEIEVFEGKSYAQASLLRA